MKVKFDDDIPNIWKVLEIHKIPWFQTTNQVFPIAEKNIEKPHFDMWGWVKTPHKPCRSHPNSWDAN